MPIHIPTTASSFGFVVEGLGPHSGRTIMLKDVRYLFKTCPQIAKNGDYRRAILDDNVLLKRTGAARKEAYVRLKRLYSLDPEILLFSVFRQLWDQEPQSQSLLTLLYAIARDPILRATTELVLDTPIGKALFASDFENVVSAKFPDQLNPNTLASIGRNTASSWTQSGHFKGRSQKERIQAISHSTTVTFALLFGYLCGQRGEVLFNTTWVRLLDSPVHELHAKAQLASKQGWLEYKKVAQVTEITFNHLLQGVGS